MTTTIPEPTNATPTQSDRIEMALRRALRLPDPPPPLDPGTLQRAYAEGADADARAAPRLWAAMAWAALGPGKRLRPRMVLAGAAAVGCDPQQAMPAACAIEFIHAYSLVHDDLPDMDDDALRRGRPTCHIAFDPATAILAGDALQTLAFEVLAQGELPASQRLQQVGVLARAAGAAGMAGGQMRDIEAERSPSAWPTTLAGGIGTLALTHGMKTGALFRAAVALGALCQPGVTPQTLAALDGFAEPLGLAFQVSDDLLDATASTAQLGRAPGSDARRSLPTYLTLLGESGCRARVGELLVAARTALETDRAVTPAPLLALVELIAQRTGEHR